MVIQGDLSEKKIVFFFVVALALVAIGVALGNLGWGLVGGGVLLVAVIFVFSEIYENYKKDWGDHIIEVLKYVH